MGVVGVPSRVTGLAAISISEEITFIPGCHASSNSSHRDSAAGLAWRLILMMTDLLAIFPDSSHSWSLRRPRPGSSATKPIAHAALPFRRADQGVRHSRRIIPWPHQYFLARGGISDVSTGSNSNFGSSASGAKTAFVVFKKFL